MTSVSPPPFHPPSALRRSVASAALSVAALLLAGCPTDPPKPEGGCKIGFLGQADAGIGIELFEIADDRLAHDISDCSRVDLVEPPQGGRVLYIGARASNLDGCGVSLSGSLRDPVSRRIYAIDGRTLNMQPIPGRPGWGGSDTVGDPQNGYAGVTNIQVCPNSGSRDVQRQDQLLEIQVKDRSGRVGTASIHVRPRCVDADPDKRFLCECTCSANSEALLCPSFYDRDAGHFETPWDAGPEDPGTCTDGGTGG